MQYYSMMATQQQGAAEGQPKDVSSTSTDQTAAMMQLFASSQAMAQMMTQQPRFEEGTGPVKWLLVGGLLHPDTTEDELIERFFSEVGRVENVKLIAGKNCGDSSNSKNLKQRFEHTRPCMGGERHFSTSTQSKSDGRKQTHLKKRGQ